MISGSTRISYLCYVSVAFNCFVEKEFCWFVLVFVVLCLSVFVRLCCSFVGLCSSLFVFVGLLVDLTLIRVIAGIVVENGEAVLKLQCNFLSSRYCALLCIVSVIGCCSIVILFRLYIVIAISLSTSARVQECKLSQTTIRTIISVAIVFIRPIVLIRYTRNSYCLDSTIVVLSF